MANPSSTPTLEQLKAIITDPNAAETLVRVADQLGKELAQPLSTSQIRALYGEVLRIKAGWLENPDRERKAKAQRAFLLLKPKMAYRAKRERGSGVRRLVEVLDPAVDLVKGDEANFRRFVEFFEAILAYHKAYGGN